MATVTGRHKPLYWVWWVLQAVADKTQNWAARISLRVWPWEPYDNEANKRALADEREA